jgi:hypothetical protein
VVSLRPIHVVAIRGVKIILCDEEMLDGKADRVGRIIKLRLHDPAPGRLTQRKTVACRMKGVESNGSSECPFPNGIRLLLG